MHKQATWCANALHRLHMPQERCASIGRACALACVLGAPVYLSLSGTVC